MRYSIEPRDRRYLKGYEVLSSARNIGQILSNKYSQKLLDRGQILSNKYSQKLLDSAKKSTIDAIKPALKRAI